MEELQLLGTQRIPLHHPLNMRTWSTYFSLSYVLLFVTCMERCCAGYLGQPQSGPSLRACSQGDGAGPPVLIGLQFYSAVTHIAKQILFRWPKTGSPTSKLNEKTVFWPAARHHFVSQLLRSQTCPSPIGHVSRVTATARHQGEALKAEANTNHSYFFFFPFIHNEL
jgi:hypothetical protein